MLDGNEYKSYNIWEGETITPEPAPQRTGYTFSGWSEIPETMPDHNVIVSGTLIAKNYTLTYKVDGEVYKTYTIACGTTITPEAAPTREGYTFSGWSGLPETMPAHDITVNGTFTINRYTLTYMVDGEIYKTSSIIYGTAITPEVEPTMEGYTFSGWSEIPTTMPAHDVVVTGSFTANTSYYLFYVLDGSVYKAYSIRCGTTIVPEPVPYKEGYTFSGWSGLPTIMPDHDVTVHGQYNINSYTLTYKVNGSVYKTFSVEYGTALTPEPAPVKKGMTFSGWGEIPATMPAYDLTFSGTYNWSRETVDGVIYQVADTLSNYASIVGYVGTNGEAELLSDIEIGGDVYEVYSIANNALPQTITLYTSVGRLLLNLWTNGYTNIKEIGTDRNLSAPELSLVAKTASSLKLSFANDYAELTETVKVSGSPIEKGENGYAITLTGLEPNYLYNGIATVILDYGDASYMKSYSFRTEPLTLTTQQPKIITVGNVIVAAQSNLDDEETKVGFEWRRTDWENDFESNFGVAYLYKGMMEGYIRNLYTERLWRYRPYYESNLGNRYYGEWVGIDPTNTSYFEPTVHTYEYIFLNGNKAEVKGYAMRGTDNVVRQGFMYWQGNTSVSLRKKANSVPDNVTVVNASGNVMIATLEDLEYETTYNYVAFVTTSEGETFYGEEQSFSTSVDPDGIKEIKNDELRMKDDSSWYSLDGKKLAKPQKGINIVRYSDGTTKKVLIK